MSDQAIKQLAAAVMLQAVKDYFKAPDTTRKTLMSKSQIIKDLRSRWMRELTDGMSVMVADQLLKHPAEIYARVFTYESEDEQ